MFTAGREGQYLIYIGLSGATMKKFLPQQLVDVYNKQMESLPKAIADLLKFNKDLLPKNSWPVPNIG
jgi:hypothetical protein